MSVEVIVFETLHAWSLDRSPASNRTSCQIPAGAVLTDATFPAPDAFGLQEEWVQFTYNGQRYECHILEFGKHTRLPL